MPQGWSILDKFRFECHKGKTLDKFEKFVKNQRNRELTLSFPLFFSIPKSFAKESYDISNTSATKNNPTFKLPSFYSTQKANPKILSYSKKLILIKFFTSKII